VHLPSQSPPGRVLRLIIVLPVSLLRSPRRRCVFHVVVSLRTSSLPSHRCHRIGWSLLLVLWSSLALAWLHCPCPEFPGTSFRRTRCSRLGEGGLSSSLAHSCCSGITHRTLIVSIVLMRFAYHVDSPSLPSLILLSSSSITPSASSSNPPSLLKQDNSGVANGDSKAPAVDDTMTRKCQTGGMTSSQAQRMHNEGHDTTTTAQPRRRRCNHHHHNITTTKTTQIRQQQPNHDNPTTTTQPR